ncbi:hypothetical protein BGZ63DRAFT_108358 [Mariannaea sp. PMI_226]|nr:hypothetical protein BGZ63DRAFT_108358 [Mariannaea sp. PMI_226]
MITGSQSKGSTRGNTAPPKTPCISAAVYQASIHNLQSNTKIPPPTMSPLQRHQVTHPHCLANKLVNSASLTVPNSYHTAILGCNYHAIKAQLPNLLCLLKLPLLSSPHLPRSFELSCLLAAPLYYPLNQLARFSSLFCFLGHATPTQCSTTMAFL